MVHNSVIVSRVCVSQLNNSAASDPPPGSGEGGGAQPGCSRQRQEVTCHLCCRGHVIMFTSPDTFSSDHHELSSHLRLCLHRVSALLHQRHLCPVLEAPPPPPTQWISGGSSAVFTLLLDLDFIQELRRRKINWVLILQRRSRDLRSSVWSSFNGNLFMRISLGPFRIKFLKDPVRIRFVKVPCSASLVVQHKQVWDQERKTHLSRSKSTLGGESYLKVMIMVERSTCPHLLWKPIRRYHAKSTLQLFSM